MKQAIERLPRPIAFGWIARLLAPLDTRRDMRHKGSARTLSSHMLLDIGLADDARGDPLYGHHRRRL